MKLTIVIKILMNFCSQKEKGEYVILLPFPRIERDYVLYKYAMWYVKSSTAEHVTK